MYVIVGKKLLARQGLLELLIGEDDVALFAGARAATVAGSAAAAASVDGAIQLSASLTLFSSFICAPNVAYREALKTEDVHQRRVAGSSFGLGPPPLRSAHPVPCRRSDHPVDYPVDLCVAAAQRHPWRPPARLRLRHADAAQQVVGDSAPSPPPPLATASSPSP